MFVGVMALRYQRNEVPQPSQTVPDFIIIQFYYVIVDKDNLLFCHHH